MDFFEALGFKHYQGSQFQDDTQLRENYIDRIYDTYIDEEELQKCDKTICDIADKLEPKPHTSREFIKEMGLEGTFQEFVTEKYYKEGHNYQIVKRVKLNE